MYKDLNINLDAVVPNENENAEQITYGQLLESLDLVPKQDDVEVVTDPESMAKAPDRVVLDGAGQSEFIKKWFKENFNEYEDDKKFVGRPRADAGTIIEEETTKEVEGGTIKVPAKRVTDSDIDLENLTKSRGLLVLRSSAKNKRADDMVDLAKTDEEIDVIEVNLAQDIDFKDLQKQVKASMGRWVETTSDYNLNIFTTGTTEKEQVKVKQVLDAIYKGVVPTEKTTDKSQESKDEVKKINPRRWFEDSDIWEDQYENRNWSQNFRKALDPLFTAALNARRIDIHNQISEADKNQEAVTRGFYDDDLVTLNDTVAKGNRAEEDTQEDDPPEGFELGEEDYGRGTKISDEITELSSDVTLDQDESTFSRFNEAIAEIAQEIIPEKGKKRSVLMRKVILMMKRDKIKDHNVFLSAAISNLVHNQDADSRQVSAEKEIDKLEQKYEDLPRALNETKAMAPKLKKLHEQELQKLYESRKNASQSDLNDIENKIFKTKKDHRIQLRDLRDELKRQTADFERLQKLKKGNSSYSIRKLFDETSIPRPPALSDGVEPISSTRITQLQDWWDSLSKADDAQTAAFYKYLRQTFDKPENTTLLSFIKNAKDVRNAATKKPEGETSKPLSRLVSTGDNWKKVDDPGVLEIGYTFDKESADKNGYGLQITRDKRQGVSQQFRYGDIITDIKVDGKEYSLKGANELDVTSVLTSALKKTKTGTVVEVKVIRRDTTQDSIPRTLGSEFGYEPPVFEDDFDLYPSLYKALKQSEDSEIPLTRALRAIAHDSMKLFRVGRTPEVEEDTENVRLWKKDNEPKRRFYLDQDIARVAKLLAGAVQKSNVGRKTIFVGAEREYSGTHRNRPNSAAEFRLMTGTSPYNDVPPLRTYEVTLNMNRLPYARRMHRLREDSAQDYSGEFLLRDVPYYIGTIFHETIHALTAPLIGAQNSGRFGGNEYNFAKQNARFAEGIKNLEIAQQILRERVEYTDILDQATERGKHSINYAIARLVEMPTVALTSPSAGRIMAKIKLSHAEQKRFGKRFDKSKRPMNLFQALVRAIMKMIGVNEKDIDESLLQRVFVDSYKVTETLEQNLAADDYISSLFRTDTNDWGVVSRSVLALRIKKR